MCGERIQTRKILKNTNSSYMQYISIILYNPLQATFAKKTSQFCWEKYQNENNFVSLVMM